MKVRVFTLAAVLALVQLGAGAGRAFAGGFTVNITANQAPEKVIVVVNVYKASENITSWSIPLASSGDVVVEKGSLRAPTAASNGVKDGTRYKVQVLTKKNTQWGWKAVSNQVLADQAASRTYNSTLTSNYSFQPLP